MELDNDCLHTKYNENVEEIILKRENIKKIAANSFYGFKFFFLFPHNNPPKILLKPSH